VESDVVNPGASSARTGICDLGLSREHGAIRSVPSVPGGPRPLRY